MAESSDNLAALEAFYQKYDPSKGAAEIGRMLKAHENNLGTLAEKIKTKYGEAPAFTLQTEIAVQNPLGFGEQGEEPITLVQGNAVSWQRSHVNVATLRAFYAKYDKSKVEDVECENFPHADEMHQTTPYTSRYS